MGYCIVAILLLVILLVYFKIAQRYNIVDVPNHRSSHTQVTIRGAGIIFPLSVLLCAIVFGKVNMLLLTPLLLISMVSFIDDVNPLPAVPRLIAHLLCVTVALYALDVYTLWAVWMVVLAYIFIIGTINAFNFMDGINGITGVYSAIVLGTLVYINHNVHFTDNALLICPLIACVIFLYFNLRKKARCFAGDAGSIGLAFWIVLLLLMVIIKTADYKYIFLLGIYGADVGYTIIKRIGLKQNLLQAHRLHVYQLLVNKGGYPHSAIAMAYGVLQLLLNLFIVFTQFHFGVYMLVTGLITLPAYLYFSRLYKQNIAPHTAPTA